MEYLDEFYSKKYKVKIVCDIPKKCSFLVSELLPFD